MKQLQRSSFACVSPFARNARLINRFFRTGCAKNTADDLNVVPCTQHRGNLSALFRHILDACGEGAEPAAAGKGPGSSLCAIRDTGPQRIRNIIFDTRPAQAGGDPASTIAAAQQRFGARRSKGPIVDIAETHQAVGERVNWGLTLPGPPAFAQLATEIGGKLRLRRRVAANIIERDTLKRRAIIGRRRVPSGSIGVWT